MSNTTYKKGYRCILNEYGNDELINTKLVIVPAKDKKELEMLIEQFNFEWFTCPDDNNKSGKELKINPKSNISAFREDDTTYYTMSEIMLIELEEFDIVVQNKKHINH
jgi:hypothetical protein